MTDRTPYRHRFSTSIIQHAVWLYHRFPPNYRDVQKLLLERGIEVRHDTLREWNVKISPLIAEKLRRLDEVRAAVGGVRHWLFLASAAPMTKLGRRRAVDGHGVVLDVSR